MNQKVSVHERVNKRHPEIDDDDVLAAWRGRIKCQMRIGPWPPQYAAAGFDKKGRALQMVAVYDPTADMTLIFHAMPLTDNVKKELGLK
jgi:hypothetical protein